MEKEIQAITQELHEMLLEKYKAAEEEKKRVRMVSKKQAAIATGLSEHELGRGARAGIYPCVRIGLGRGKYLFDIDLLNEVLTERALANIKKDDVSNGAAVDSVQEKKSTSYSSNGIRKLAV